MSAQQITTSADKPSSEDAVNSLTGYEEIAISKHFGAEVMELAERKPTMLARALVFVFERRSGVTDKDAKETAMGLSLKAATEYFADGEDEPMPDDPITESGKGGGTNG